MGIRRNIEHTDLTDYVSDRAQVQSIESLESLESPESLEVYDFRKEVTEPVLSLDNCA